MCMTAADADRLILFQGIVMPSFNLFSTLPNTADYREGILSYVKKRKKEEIIARGLLIKRLQIAVL